MKQGRPLAPYHPALFWACTACLLAVLIWVKVPAVAGAGLSALGWLSDRGVPAYAVWFEKSALPLPRLLHVLALAYVLSNVPAIGRFARTRMAGPLALLGRHGLPVFATGSVLCMVFQAAKVGIGSSFLADTAMLAGGIAVQYLLALALSAGRRANSVAPDDGVARVAETSARREGIMTA
jgi:hypothetical protein